MRAHASQGLADFIVGAAAAVSHVAAVAAFTVPVACVDAVVAVSSSFSSPPVVGAAAAVDDVAVLVATAVAAAAIACVVVVAGEPASFSIYTVSTQYSCVCMAHMWRCVMFVVESLCHLAATITTASLWLLMTTVPPPSIPTGPCPLLPVCPLRGFPCVRSPRVGGTPCFRALLCLPPPRPVDPATFVVGPLRPSHPCCN
jgi:hypothetical protein